MKKIYKIVFTAFIILSMCCAFLGCLPADENKEKKLYFVAFSQTEHGLISLSESGDLPSGSSVTVTAFPNPGCSFEYFVINDQKIYSDTNVYTITDIKSDITVSAVFREIEYKFETVAGENGSVEIADGANRETKILIVTPDEHYRIKTLRINGEEVELSDAEKNGYTGSYTAFADMKAEAEFEKKIYKVTTSDKLGVITFDKTEFVYGDSVTLSIALPEGGEVTDLFINGEQFKNRIENGRVVLENYGCDIIADIEIKSEKFLVSVASKIGDDGFEKIALSSNQALKGGSVTVTVTPKKGKKLFRATVNGNACEFNGNVIEIKNINCDISIVVESANQTYSVIKNQCAGGVIDSSKDQFIYGDTVELYYEQAVGYSFIRFTVNGQVIESEDGRFYIRDLAEDAIVSAEFELESYSITVIKSVGGEVEVNEKTYTVEDEPVVSIRTAPGYSVGKVMINGNSVEIDRDKITIKRGTVGNLNLSVEFIKNKYTLSVKTIGRGTAIADKSVFTVDDTVTVAFNSEVGYAVASLKINGKPIQHEESSIVLSGLTENTVVEVVFEAIRYRVNLTKSEGGDVIVVPENGFTIADTVVIAPLPNDGYEIESISVNGVDKKLEGGRVTLTNQCADLNVDVKFTVIKYSVAVKCGIGGKISVDKTVFGYGDSVVVTVEPDEGYKIISLSVNGRDYLSGLSDNKIIIKNNSDLQIEAEFAVSTVKTYSLSAEIAQKAGSVYFVSSTVAENGTAIFTVNMNQGYEIESVFANGKTVSSVNGIYRIDNVKTDIVVKVNYSLVEYSVTVTQNDKVDLSAPVCYTIEDNVVINAEGKPGYEVEYITVNGNRMTPENGKVEFTGLTGNLTIGAETKLAEYSVTITESDKYTASLSSQKTNIESTVEINVTPAEGYNIVAIVINGKEIPFTGRTYRLSGVSENTVVTFVVRSVQYNIKISVYHNGSLTTDCGNVIADKSTYGEGDVVTFTVTEAEGYYLGSVTINGVDYTGKISSGRFTYSGKYDIVVVANFRAEGIILSGRVFDIADDRGLLGATVVISGYRNYTVKTEWDGKFSLEVENGTYTVEVQSSDYKYCEKKQITGNNKDIYVDLYVANSLFGNVEGYLTDFSVMKDAMYDFENFKESLTVGTEQFGGNTNTVYFKDLVSDCFVLTFTPGNICDTATNYEKEPGIGIIINAGSNKFNCQFVAKRARVIVNGNWSNLPESANCSYYDFNKVGEKHSLAFVKDGDTVYFLAMDDNGMYAPVFTYSNELLRGDCSYGLSISKQNNCTVNMRFDDIAVSTKLNDLSTTAKKFVEIIDSEGGYLTVENTDPDGCLIGKTYKLYATPDYGKQVNSIYLDGEEVEFISDGAGGGYCYITLADKNVKASAVFGNYGTGKLNYSDGTGYGGQDYDKTLFYRNDLITDGADPGVMYVSEEEDPINGGWFYMTVTSHAGYNKIYAGNKTFYESAAFLCYRSKDLASWQSIGVLDGYSLGIKSGEWPQDCFWAPEMLRDPKSGKYFLYFSARSKIGNGTDYSASNAAAIDGSDRWDRLYLGIAMSDYPQGPYNLINAEEYNKAIGVQSKNTNANGEVITGKTVPVNFAKNVSAIKNRGYDFWPAIDVSPFIDSDGTMYLYFSQHISSVSYGNIIWSMKMKDFISPDYSTMTLVSVPGYSGVTSVGKSNSIYFNNGKTNYNTAYGFTRYSYDGSIYGSGVNEGVNVIKDEESGKYFLTYSPFGYGSRRYSVMQAVSDNPQGPFVKLDAGVANPVLGIYGRNDSVDYNMNTDISASIDYIAGTGHHCFVKAGTELFAVYHAFYNPVKNSNGQGTFLGRRIAADRVYFTYNEQIGSRVLVGNGPTDTLQASPAVSSGYENITSSARITATNADENSVKYLSDGMFVVHNSYLDREFTANGGSVISVKFPAARTVRAVMLYSSAKYNYALKSVREIKLFTADGKTVSLNNISINEDYVDIGHKTVHYGGAIIADFDAVSVTGMEITVRVEDKLVTDNSTIKISDLVILGKCDQNKASDRAEYASSSGAVNHEGIKIDGKPFDKIWQSVKPMDYNTNGTQFEMRSYLGKEGAYYLFTVYEDRVCHADENGNTYKYNGLRRFYKNSGWVIDLYAGNGKYDSSKTVRITADAYNFIINGGKTANVAIYVDGKVNSKVRSYSVEIFVPYEQFGCISAEHSYAKAQYRKTANVAVSNITPFNVAPDNSGIVQFC